MQPWRYEYQWLQAKHNQLLEQLKSKQIDLDHSTERLKGLEEQCSQTEDDKCSLEVAFSNYHKSSMILAKTGKFVNRFVMKEIPYCILRN